MPFNSFNFWLLFPFIFIICMAIPQRAHRWQNGFLLLVSYLLYMNWNPAFAIVLFGITLITYIGGIFFAAGKQRMCIWFALLALLPLVVFKYYGFINENVTSLLETAGLHFSLPGLNWAIPVGISFFTFQAVGYVFDVYHGRCEVEKNFLDYALFVSFFPQITSGPISTASELMPQIKSPQRVEYRDVVQGLKWLVWGMFIKLVIADRLGMFVDIVYANYIHYSGAMCFVASVAYTLQIYCDFAGYSLMAIGIASTLGFRLINNFNRPYFAASVTEFWRRWHISLTRWLTTHVYIALGGSRCSRWKQYLNIMVTFLVSGLWHGANWTFVVWGAIHGLLQVIEKVLFGEKIKAEIKSHVRHLTLSRGVRIVVTFLLVSFAWIFFRMPSLADSCSVIGRILTLQSSSAGMPLDSIVVISLGMALPVLILREWREEFCPQSITLLNKPIVKWMFYLFLFCFLLTMGVLDGGQFIYVSF
ncbi:MAG: MBOAT family O-acyltransferase [Prevotellaceae bacterium]|nr:MBOAT family O-acyltransferase [Prevotellaceae bacterium]